MNYVNTLILVAPDCPAVAAEAPPERAAGATIGRIEYELIHDQPYTLTHEEVQFTVNVRRRGIGAELLAEQRHRLWDKFFAKPMACMRTSALPKRYGWGLHFDHNAKVALVAVQGEDYARLAADPAVVKVQATRSKRP
ncbi:hypothetical protein BurJ1DRAFT_0331 [Burkholderiales bacterium JOSHI_001]|nr:hypothetical protein BurJ1DRAFT_0331 [Burkholderiales bacterium JOSHI_001]